MLLFLLGMEKRLRLNLLLLGLIFGGGILPDKNVEAGKCYSCSLSKDCRSLLPGKPVDEQTCPNNFCRTFFFAVTELATNSTKVLKASRMCQDLTPDQLECAKDKLGSLEGCFQEHDRRLNEFINKCIRGNGEGWKRLRTGPFQVDSGNTNETNVSSTEQTPASPSPPTVPLTELSDFTECFCTGDLCNNWKEPTAGGGGGKGKASVVSSNNLSLFLAILGAASGSILVSGGHLNRNIKTG